MIFEAGNGEEVGEGWGNCDQLFPVLLFDSLAASRSVVEIDLQCLAFATEKVQSNRKTLWLFQN